MAKKYAISTSMQWFGEELIDYAKRWQSTPNHLEIKTQILAENPYHCPSDASLKDRTNKVSIRAKALTDQELALLTTTDMQSQNIILFISYLKTYALAYEFVCIWLLPKIQLEDCIITQEEFDRYYEHQQLLYPDDLQLTDGGYKRFRNQLFMMLVKSGLFTKEGHIFTFKRMLVSSELLAYYQSQPEYEMFVF